MAAEPGPETPGPPALTPVEEAARAIAAARERVVEAMRELQEKDDPNLALETIQACTDDLARALWFLRRAQREGAVRRPV